VLGIVASNADVSGAAGTRLSMDDITEDIRYSRAEEAGSMARRSVSLNICGMKLNREIAHALSGHGLVYAGAHASRDVGVTGADLKGTALWARSPTTSKMRS
jgi:hypothetical protein